MEDEKKMDEVAGSEEFVELSEDEAAEVSGGCFEITMDSSTKICAGENRGSQKLHEGQNRILQDTATKATLTPGDHLL